MIMYTIAEEIAVCNTAIPLGQGKQGLNYLVANLH